MDNNTNNQNTIEQLQAENRELKQDMIELHHRVLNAEMQFSQLSKAAFDAIAICEDFNIILANNKFCTLFNFEEDEVIGKNIIPLIHPTYQQEFESNTDFFYESSTVETICLSNNKSPFPARIRGKLIPHHNDTKHLYKVLVIQDITHEKEVEHELAESEESYRKLFEESQDAIYISDIKGSLLSVNNATVQLFGIPKNEMIGMSVYNLYANPDDRDAFMVEMNVKGAVSNYEITLKKNDGTHIECFFSSTVRKNSQNEIIGYQGIIRDVTEHKRTTELIKAKELAEKSAILKERFLANMSHEIRTPMNAVLGMLNLIEDTQLNPQQKKYFEGIRISSEHLLVLINDILDFSKIEAGKLDFEKINFNLYDVLTNVVQTLGIKASEKNLDLLLHIEPDVPKNLVGDPTRLLQIMLNLVSNGIKFTYKGSVQISVNTVEEDAKHVRLHFRVKDTGIGIPADKIDLIFQSFSQVTTSTTRKFGGTGLGLTITKKLVEIQGGSIHVNSKLGEGSTFLCELRYKKTEGDAPKTEPINLKNISKQPLHNLRILLTEDNELNRVVATDTIKKWGENIQIDAAENGKIAIEKLQTNTYHLVLMDVQMPEMDGITATQIIRNDLKLKDLPILAMTAYATTGEAEKVIIAGMNDYISKPFDPNKLYQKIVALLQNDLPTITAQNITKTQPFPAVEAEKNAVPSSSTTVSDLRYLRESTGNDNELMQKMIEIMLQETPDELQKMQQYAAESQWSKLRSVAHKFKSTVIYMGLPENIGEIVKNIQIFCDTQQHLNELPQMVATLTQAVEQACTELQNELLTLQS